MKSAKSWVSEGEWVFCRRDPAQFLQSRCANPLAIVALAFCLLLTRVPVASGHSCPGDATAIRIGLSVSVTHPNDQPLATTGCVPGDELWVRVALTYTRTNDDQSINAAIENGRLLIRINGDTTDVTPPGGIPLIGGDGGEGGEVGEFADNKVSARRKTEYACANR